MADHLLTQPRAIFIMGPTASGKTDLAIALSQSLPVEIINVDSAQIYRGMDIGTAKPDSQILKLAPHRLISFCDPAQSYSAAEFAIDAKREMADTLALIERSMKVMTAIQARLHASMKREFVLISDLVHDFGADQNYEYESEDEAVKAEDFDGRLDIIPVSDPNSSTMSQRIMQYQAALQLSQQAPQMYDLPELHRQMLDVLGIQDADSIIPLSKEAEPRDPVSENMDVLNGKPLKAFSYQDHDAHIQVHMNAIQDPKIQQLVGQSPMAGTIQAAMAAHIQEHLGFKYRREIEKQLGVELPPEGEPLPEDVEVKLSRLVAEASDRLFRKDVMEEQMRENQEKLNDPVFQLQQQELQLEAADLERKAQTDTARMVAKLKEAQMRQETELLRIKSQERMEGARLGVQIAQESLDAQQRKESADKRQVLDTAKILADVGKNLMEPNNSNTNNSG